MKHIVILLSLLSTLSACTSTPSTGSLSKNISGVEPSVPPRPVQPTSSPEEAEDHRTLKKLSGYIGCFNKTMPVLNDTIQRYYAWVNPKTGPSCREDNISYKLYQLDQENVDLCNQALEAVSKEATTPLDAAAKTYIDLHAAFVPLVKKMYEYYDLQRYREDACKNGQIFDKDFSSLVARYPKAQTDFSNAINDVKEGLDRRMLDRFEKQYGKNLYWHLKTYILAAQSFVTKGLVYDENGQFSESTYIEKYPDFEIHYQNLNAYVESHPDEVKTSELSSLLKGPVYGLYSNAHLLKLDIDEKKNITTQPKNILNTYNGLINDVNYTRSLSTQ